MASKSQVLAAARRRFGPKVYVEDRPNADTAASRAAKMSRLAEIAARTAAIDEEQKKYPPAYPALLKACRFVVDVDGDNPSIHELAKLLGPAERALELLNERGELFTERREMGCGSYRWTLLKDCGFCAEHIKGTDTLDEMLAYIETLKPSLPLSR